MSRINPITSNTAGPCLTGLRVVVGTKHVLKFTHEHSCGLDYRGWVSPYLRSKLAENILIMSKTCVPITLH
jgi:hypothetical protein